jgi:hypothetical protein
VCRVVGEWVSGGFMGLDVGLLVLWWLGQVRGWIS